ncbi:MAG TPA: phytanoyl-CoA dioxygenase family protein [Candidatus Glassbacteria bacterium]|nr:phytanoyl-CoA dioxygenase family protein [Candidatus Glassbacteria bacterium]
MPALTSNKLVIDISPDKFGQLRESNGILEDGAALRRRIKEDGYLLIRGGLDREVVLAARREIVEKLDSVGEIDRSSPLIEAVGSGRSNRSQIDQDAFLANLRSGEAVKRLAHGMELRGFFTRLLDCEVKPLDYVWVRSVPLGGFTGIHYDWVYMGRGTKRLHTTWVPVGDVPMEGGSLLILENSHRQEELIGSYGQLDVDRDRDKNPYRGAEGGWYSENPLEVQRELGGRWLTTDFHAGDMLVFGMWTLHCSLDNNSPAGRTRITLDTRWQPASDPIDERWVGPKPAAHSSK